MSETTKNRQKKPAKQPSHAIHQQSIIHTEIEEKFVASPIPPSEMAAQYESILPGAADRIISLAENEAVHRREIEKITLEAQIELLREAARDTRRGQFFGFIIGLSAILVSAYMSTNGAQVVGGAIGVSSIVGLVSVFVHGRRQQSQKSSHYKGSIPETGTPRNK